MRIKWIKLIVVIPAAAGCFLFNVDRVVQSQTNKSSVLRTKHDFTMNSPSTIRSTNEDESCAFCHTPHNASPSEPLWNHTSSTNTSAALYTSTTMKAAVTPATSADSSKLCLACHDGTVALGDTVNNGVIPFVQGGNYQLPATSGSNLNGGTGYRDDHPFAFVPVTGTEIQNPAPGDQVKLDHNGKVQCTSCHDPHTDDPSARKFLVKTNLRSELCLTCHTKTGWLSSTHRQPVSTVNDSRYTATQGSHTGYTGVSNNACESCHRPHTPLVGQRLVKFVEENTCYKCHNGTVAETARNIQTEFQNKTYRHPTPTTPSVHDASENPTTGLYRLPETSAGTARHSECADCHNSHASNAQTASPPAVNGNLLSVSGITTSGTGIASSPFEYQVCFKCHSDSANKPQFADTGNTGVGYGRNPKRQTDQANPSRYNTRIEFSSLVSWHPVSKSRGLSTGTNGDVPSLRTYIIGSNGQSMTNRPLSSTSVLYCVDCHNNDTGRNLGTGTAPVGPHGSNIAHLLERSMPYNTPPTTPGGSMGKVTYSTSAYALCNKCHDVSGSIMVDRSFKEHNKHISGAGTSCATCHDSHGVNGGTATNNKYLINFDLSIVGPSSSGILRYDSTGLKQGRCYLTCHGKNHNPEAY
jgi:predicted CXXCH cytochrome family protein